MIKVVHSCALDEKLHKIIRLSKRNEQYSFENCVFVSRAELVLRKPLQCFFTGAQTVIEGCCYFQFVKRERQMTLK